MAEINYEKTFEVRWSDLDANFHVRHSAYADYCATTRLLCLSENGFSMGQFAQENVGPVLFKETLNYLKEIPADTQVKVNVQITGLSQDGRKWKIRHEIFRTIDGARSAIVEVEGAWMSTRLRKIVEPPPALKLVFEQMKKSSDFAWI